MKNYTKQIDRVSEMFLDALKYTGGGSTHVYCNCGIDHYGTDTTHCDYDEDFKFPEESDTVKHHDYESVYFYLIEGRSFVHDCEGCMQYLRRYEHFIWNERDIIRNYLKIRIDQELQWAQQETVLNKLMEDCDKV